MTLSRRAAALSFWMMVCVALPCGAQTAAPPAPPAAPALSPQAMEDFLMHAQITARKGTSKGVTNAQRVTLTDGHLTHDAQVQNVDIFKQLFDATPGSTEVNFRDTYRYNIAGYRLSLLLGLDNIPMSVPRTVDGKPAAVTWWIDSVMMDEGERQKKKPVSPNPNRTSGYIHIMRVFDELIQNRDRNAGNILWTQDWTMWLIDHTRAFRVRRQLLKPQLLERCERTMCGKMRELTASRLTEVMGDALQKAEIESLLARRDLILKLFDDRIAARGEGAVLYTLPRPPSPLAAPPSSQ